MTLKARLAIEEHIGRSELITQLHGRGLIMGVPESKFRSNDIFLEHAHCVSPIFDLTGYLLGTNHLFNIMDKEFKKGCTKPTIEFNDSEEFLNVSENLKELSKKVSEYVIPKVQKGLNISLFECTYDWKEDWGFAKVILKTKDKLDPVKKIDFLDELYDELYEKMPEASFKVTISIIRE